MGFSSSSLTELPQATGNGGGRPICQDNMTTSRTMYAEVLLNRTRVVSEEHFALSAGFRLGSTPRILARPHPHSPPNRFWFRSLAFSASVARSRGGAFTTSPSMSRVLAWTISRTAWSKSSWFTDEGLFMPLSLRTYWSDDAWISSGVAGGLKLARTLMFRHMAERILAQALRLPQSAPFPFGFQSGWAFRFGATGSGCPTGSGRRLQNAASPLPYKQ